ncbi:MAG: glutamine--fructose-6-phosphate transaminase (isomerizing) [Fusobacteria bacterium]|nr:glutamine--fructose-6-phosphate transaminase (isomerizing) [Fusobacteriota bacterium]
MCGIVGYIGDNKAKDVVIEGLEKLEYRGYDSAGIAVLKDGNLFVEREVGKLSELKNLIRNKDLMSNIAIGHTRWATHGEPSVANAHPHTSTGYDIAVVHNGIIENFMELREMLSKKGHVFRSATDTETIVHLIADYYIDNLEIAVIKALEELEGAYAIAVVSKHEPDRIIVARKGSPLIIGVGEHENIIASDVTATLKYTDKVVYLNDGEVAVVKADSVKLMNSNGVELPLDIKIVDWDISAAEKLGYKHFMLKEIFEQPEVIINTLRGKIYSEQVEIKEISAEILHGIKRVSVIACGTSFHAGLVGKYIIEEELRIPVSLDVASEFRYRNPIIEEDTLYLVVSQSGETADTLAALREVKAHGAKVIGIVNVVGSTIAREANGVIYTNAGPEIGVASTKAFIAQLVSFYLLMLQIGRIQEKISKGKEREYIKILEKIPNQIENILKNHLYIQSVSKSLTFVKSIMYVGRNINYPIALEGALKLKEISYIHAEGYQAGELKHGPIALIDEFTPSVAVCVKGSTYAKTLSNIQEIKARKGKVIIIATEGDDKIKNEGMDVLYIPEISELFSPLLTVIYMQLIAYYVAEIKGLDVDKPRNLAKSVTVE